MFYPSSLNCASFSLFGIVFVLIFVDVLPGQEPVDFAHDILPTLKSRCAECHANGTFKGGLSLESRAKLIDSGTIEVGDKAESDLYARLKSGDPEERMPPKGTPLSVEQIKAFGDWIDQGIKWPEELTLAQPTFSRPLAIQKVDLPIATTSRHPVDWIIDRYFLRNSVQHAPSLQPAEFLRRAKLDLLGQLPISEEIENCTDESPKDPRAAREKLIDDLLLRDVDYADHWMSFWNDLLRNDYVGTGYIDGGRKQITGWLYESLLKNKPYDQLVRELIDPTDESAGFIKGIKWRGRVNASQIEPLQFSQNISQVFLGINMKCASCHDSFIDDWKLDDAYGIAAITSEQPLEMHRCDVPTGKMATSKFVFPSVGEIDHAASRQERLQQLAKLLTSEKNGRFARTIVNRIWHRMMGRGLVHPVDVMANEAWSEPLLDFLAADFIANGYDIKHTLRLIATSNIYATQSVCSVPISNEEYVFRGVAAKRLTAEQFVDAVWALTGNAPTQADAQVFKGVVGEPTAKWIWKDNKASQVPGGEVVQFRYSFELESIPAVAKSVTTCDNGFTMFVNGKKVAKGTDWTKATTADIRPRLVKGRNVILIRTSNGGDAPNPAALFCEVVLNTNKNELSRIGTDASWQWTKQKTDNLGNAKSQNAVWSSAVPVEEAEKIYQSSLPSLRQAIGMFESQGGHAVRASLVKSNMLMRSLGRPNREQVVTTRPAELSTLQALELSNGELLNDWIVKGAKRWSKTKSQNGWSDKELIKQLFVAVLSRPVTAEEAELFLFEPDQNELLHLENLIWSLIMLPEFQFVK